MGNNTYLSGGAAIKSMMKSTVELCRQSQMLFKVTFTDLSTGGPSGTVMTIEAPNERAITPILAAAVNNTGLAVANIKTIRHVDPARKYPRD